MAEVASIDLAEAFRILQGFAAPEHVISSTVFRERLMRAGIDVEPPDVSRLMVELAEAGYIEYRQQGRLGLYYLIPDVAPPEPEAAMPRDAEPSVPEDIRLLVLRVQQNPRYRHIRRHIQLQLKKVSSEAVHFYEVVKWMDKEGGPREALLGLLDDDELSSRLVDDFADNWDGLRRYAETVSEPAARAMSATPERQQQGNGTDAHREARQPPTSTSHQNTQSPGGVDMVMKRAEKGAPTRRTDKIPDDILQEYGRLTGSNIWQKAFPQASVAEFVEACDKAGGVWPAIKARGIIYPGRFTSSTEKSMPLLRKHAAALDALSEEDQEDARSAYRKGTGSTQAPSKPAKAKARPKQVAASATRATSPPLAKDASRGEGQDAVEEPQGAGQLIERAAAALAAAESGGHVRALLESTVAAFSSPPPVPISHDVQEALQISAIKSAFTALTTRFLPVLPHTLPAEQAWDLTRKHNLVEAFRAAEGDDQSLRAGVYLLIAGLILQGKHEKVEEIFAVDE